MTWAQPAGGRYYDLLHLPHGHLPVNFVKFWRHFPVPVKQIRHDELYYCPYCGERSFYKIKGWCWTCEDLYFRDDPNYSAKMWARIVRPKRRREWWRKLYKKLEYALLPVLILLNYIPRRILPRRLKKFRAWYVVSPRHHEKDPDYWEWWQRFEVRVRTRQDDLLLGDESTQIQATLERWK